MKAFYHYSSKGLTKDILFENEQEFIAGMNRIAVCLAMCKEKGMHIVILAFCLMDNHFHFIFYGEKEYCDFFVDTYKKLSSMWIVKHRGRPLADNFTSGSFPINPNKVGEKIAYLLRNPVAAGIRITPQGYRWSSGILMFSEVKSLLTGTTKIGDLSYREKRSLISSHTALPENWIVQADGLIWPGCYTDYKTAEAHFPSVRSFMFELNNFKVDSEIDAEEVKQFYSLPDSEVRFRAVQTCMEYYQKERISMCSLEERVSVAKILQRELHCNDKQLARVLRIQPEVLGNRQ
ncbi:MAG: hypothetical protein IKX45_00750 [Bacteroidales bacterium]|nr:hypothetical protein [Bacteroidales bacterium]